MIPPCGNGGCWWRQCCSSWELSSSLVRVGRGWKGQDGVWGSLGCVVTEGQGLETSPAPRPRETMQTQTTPAGRFFWLQQGALFPGCMPPPSLSFSSCAGSRGSAQMREADTQKGLLIDPLHSACLQAKGQLHL